MLISIIIPVYNAEKYIHRSVNSIACQMTEEIELLLVDDGSTDDSGTICDEFAKNDPHIRVIHKENGGSSSARNAGLLAAQGEYISFADVDDYVDTGLYQSVISVIREHHPDCIDFGWRYICRTGDTLPHSNQIPKDTLLGMDMIKDHIIPTLLNLSQDKSYFVCDFVWNKLYRRDKIISGNVRFSETRRTWEDRLFVLDYLCDCKNYYSISRCFYNYMDIPDSKSRRFYVERLRIIVENYGLYIKMFGKDYDFDTPYVNTYWAAVLEKMILQSVQQTEQKETITAAVASVLQENVVKQWFAKRIPKNRFEQKVSTLIIENQTDRVIRCYTKRAAKDRRNAAVKNMKKRLVQVLRKHSRKVGSRKNAI